MKCAYFHGIPGPLARRLPVALLLLSGILVYTAVNVAHAQAAPRFGPAGTAVAWSHMEGIIQPGSFVGTGTGKVTGGGFPWYVVNGQAYVNLTTGALAFHVQGLVFAGGNFIGTPGAITSVKGTLVCDTTGTANGNSTLVDSPMVTLSAAGNASFFGNLGTIPAVCSSEPNIAFLIRTGSGLWLASGAVRLTGQ
jgi:hypothetical protein